MASKMDRPAAPDSFMDTEKLLEVGPEVLAILGNYWDTLRQRKPKPDAKPGEVFDLFPKEAPHEPESWSAILGDVETHILAKNTHWHHPHFFSYYPTPCTYPSVLADILSTGIACIGFTWNSSPSCTEVELAMLDWLVRALALPEHFLNSHPGPGGGIIQPTASDATLVAVLGARGRILHRDDQEKPPTPTEAASETSDHSIKEIISSFQTKLTAIVKTVISLGRQTLVMYCSSQAHSSVERAALLANVTIRHVEADAKLAMRGKALQKAIDDDKNKGFTPFCVIATLGSTPTCAFDNLVEIGRVCQKESLWLHVDAAYAGSSLICPEFRYIAEGIENADSFNFNAHKWLGVNFDCSPMWFKDRHKVEAGFKVDPLYLKHANQGKVPDLRHMQIALGRRFRSIKIWFVLRAFGISGLQAYIRQFVRLAKEFEALVRADKDFEIVNDVVLGLVCFRLKGENSRSELLMSKLEEDGSIQLVPSTSNDLYYLRLSVNSTLTTSEDIRYAFDVVKRCAEGC